MGDVISLDVARAWKQRQQWQTADGLEAEPDTGYLAIDELISEVPDDTVDVSAAAIESIQAAQVRRAVRSLPGFERHVITRRYGFDGINESQREIANRLGLSKSAIANAEERALTQLRAYFLARFASDELLMEAA